jgi:flagellar basal-body rod modification protein FlgD
MSTTAVIDPVLSAASAAQAAEAARNAKPTTLGKDEFLKLLIAQLQNQDPLSPTDDKEFVAQMATFSSLEQLIDANSNLQGLALGQANLINAQALGLIGKEALVSGGDSVRISQGRPDQIVYSLPAVAGEATLTIYSKDGTPVRVFELDRTASGRVSLEWDGTDAAGNRLADGEYRIEVRATDTQGQPLTVSLFRSLSIDGVNFGGNGISLVSGGQEIPFESIIEIRAGRS